MTCPNCNSEISDLTSKFCHICGTPLPVSEPVSEPAAESSSEPVVEPVSEPSPTEQKTEETTAAESSPAVQEAKTATEKTAESTKAKPEIPFEYKPISAWGYVGWNLLFGIPVVGFIILIILSVGGTKNKNLKNYARSFWCLYLLLLLTIVIALIISGGKIMNMRLF